MTALQINPDVEYVYTETAPPGDGNATMFGVSARNIAAATMLGAVALTGGTATIPQVRPAVLAFSETFSARLTTPTTDTEPQTPAVDAAPQRTDSEATNWVKEHSGLTWEQLGRAFGVSRRAVHMWANGGRLNEANAMRLQEFVAVIQNLEAAGATTPDAVRSRLLEIDAAGSSILGRLQAERHNGPTWGTPHGPEHYIDAVHTPLGETES